MNISKINTYSPNFGAVRKSAVRHAITDCEDFIDLSRLKTLVDGQKNNSLYDISCKKSHNGYYTYYTIVPKKGISLDENSTYYRLEAKKTNSFNSLRDACKKATFLEELDIPFNVEQADFENMVTNMLTEAEDD